MTIMEKSFLITEELCKKKRPNTPDRFAIMELISTVLWTAYRQHWRKDSSEVVYMLSYMEKRFLDGTLRAAAYSMVSDAIRDADQWHTPLKEICASIRGETSNIIIVNDEDGCVSSVYVNRAMLPVMVSTIDLCTDDPEREAEEREFLDEVETQVREGMLRRIEL